MKKAKFKYYGHLSVVGQITLLIGCCWCLVISGTKFWKSAGMQVDLTLLAGIFSLVGIIYWILNNILTNINQLEFEDRQLIITNLLTKKIQKIELTELAGYKFNGLTLTTQLINLQGETIAAIYNPFYKKLNAFLLEMDIQQIDVDESYFRRLAL